MSNISHAKFASNGTLIAIAFMAFLMTASHPPKPLATTNISFESLPAPGSGTGGLEVRNQFAASGVIFQPVTALDYSLGIPILNFAHSGTKAVELCHAIEFCTGKLDVSFTAPQRRVKVWTGYAFRLDSAQAVILRAFDGSGNQVASNTKVLGPSSAVIPISTPLEVAVPSATIVRVTAGFLGAEPPNVVMFNNALAFDDLEFDDQGPAPTCPATQPPSFTVTEPTDGRILIQNAFSLDANLTTLDPFATLQINATGSAGTRTFGPFFVASGRIQIFNISSMLSPGQNTLVFIAKDCAGTTQVTRTVHFRSVTRTSIHVINESGANVQTARVYANGFFIGLTDANGMLSMTPPLSTGTRLVARKLVAESSTFRDNHAQGSFQNWKYRVYTSSMAVNNDGSLTAHAVNYHPDPNVPQVLRVMRQNALIGLHVVASIEWDASAAEMETAKQKLTAASKFLYNATDGQMFIEQVEVVDDKKFWKEADYRIYANQSLGAHVNFPPKGAFLVNNVSTYLSRMNMRIQNEPHEFVHEFGHYGFRLEDEYKGEPAGCTAILISTTTPPGNIFGPNGSKASCIMDSNWVASKLCSHRLENPHKNGTKQGNSSCWTNISERYRDSGGNPRWTLQTPDTRGAIPDVINSGDLPLDDMRPKLTFQNASRPNLCQPITVLATNSDGTAHHNREIWLKTTYGQNILQGKTNEFGQLTVTGGHVGDRVEGTTIEFVNCTVTARLRPGMDLRSIAINTMPISLSQDVEQGRQRLEVGSMPFKIVTLLKPIKKGGQIIVVTKDAAGRPFALAAAPVVSFKTADANARQVRLRYHSKTKSYLGTIAELPINSEIEIAVEATNRQRQRAESVTIFRISRLDPRAEMEVISPDGQLTLTVPEKSLPTGARISIGSHSAALPDLPAGYTFASGPFAVWSYPADNFYRPATVSFQLPRARARSAFANYTQDSLRVFHYDGQRWTDIGAVVPSPHLDIVTAKTARLGVFALVGKVIPKQNQQSTPLGMFGGS
jgi:hypothetical protein